MDKDEPYYIPITLSGIEKFIHGMIRENDELDGSEYVIDAAFADDDSYGVPQGSIFFTLQKGGLPGEEAEYGTLVMMPEKVKRLQ